MRIHKGANTIRVLLYCGIILLISVFSEGLVRHIEDTKGLIERINEGFIQTSWQVFSSLSTLTIALLSILQEKADISYYGLSIKELLCLPKSHNPLAPNYWDKVLVVLCLTVATGLIILFKRNITALIVELLNFVILLQLIDDSITVFLRPEKFKEIALKYTDSRLKNIKNKDNLEEAKRQIQRLGREANVHMEHSVNPDDNTAFEYLLRWIRESSFTGSEPPNNMRFEEATQDNEVTIQILMALQQMYKQAIVIRATPYVDQVMRVIVYISDNTMRNTYSLMILSAYYKGLVSFERLSSHMLAYRNLSYSKPYLLNDLLIFAKNSIDSNNAQLFGEVILTLKLSSETNPSKSTKGKIVLIIVIYLYYYCFGEPLIRKEDAETRIDLIKHTINKLEPAVSLQKICKEAARELVQNAGQALAFYEEDSMMWEVMPEGEAKFMHIYQVAQECTAFLFCAFGISFYTRESTLANFSLPQLVAIHAIVVSLVNKESSVAQKYERFCQWMDVNFDPDDSVRYGQLLSQLEISIKKSMQKQTSEIRSKRDYYLSKLNELFDSTLDKAKQNVLFGIPCHDLRKYTIYENKIGFIEDIRSFSENTSLFGLEEVIISQIQDFLFREISKTWLSVGVEGRGQFQNDYEQILKMAEKMEKEGISINSVYNYPIYEVGHWFDEDVHEETKEQISLMSKSIHFAGFWENHQNATIYLDSTKGIPYFYFNRTTIGMDEYLNDEDLEKNLEKKDAYYPASDAQQVPYTREEAITYHKLASLRIWVQFYLFVPKNRNGFYSIYK